MSQGQILSVSDLTRCIRGVIEAEDLFRDVWIRGEVSNLTKHSSGHVYFSLKDEGALI
jgi:exodeoxyribonuclease VII large subunit